MTLKCGVFCVIIKKLILFTNLGGVQKDEIYDLVFIIDLYEKKITM